MRPPSRFTVPEPVAWFPEKNLLIQEKAPGASIVDAMQQQSGETGFARDAALWLRELSTLKLNFPRAGLDFEDSEKRSRDLSDASGNARVIDLWRDANLMLAREPGDLCPSHGDFHPMNVFVSRDRVTAIDLDTLASRDRETDIGYFLAQTAIFGVHLFGSFGETSNLRNEFLRHCGPLDRHRVVAHMAAAILQSLHYDLCILRVRNESFDALAGAAASLLASGSTDLA